MSTINHDCDWPFIDQCYLHLGAESSRCDIDSLNPYLRDKLLVELVSNFWRSRFEETGPAPFSCIGQERELADDQHFTLNILQTEIHLPSRIFKNPQTDDFVDQIIEVGLGISRSDTEQHDQTAANLTDDFPANRHGTATTSLDDSSH